MQVAVNLASTRTTQLYDRRSDEMSLDEVEDGRAPTGGEAEVPIGGSFRICPKAKKAPVRRWNWRTDAWSSAGGPELGL